MTLDEIKTIGSLCDALRNRGVTYCKVADIELRFTPAERKEMAVDPLAAFNKQMQPDICACGCLEAMHGPGGCLRGCAPSKCDGEPEAKAEAS